MGTETKVFDMLSGVEHKQTPMYASLLGFRESMKQLMGLSKFPLVTTDDHKHMLRQQETKTYPFGWFSLQDISIKRDMHVNKIIKRMGISMKQSSSDNASIVKAYLFPADINVDIHVVVSDVTQALMFAEKFVIFEATDAFSFQLEIPDVAPWMVTLGADGSSISIPTSVLEDEGHPGGIELNFQLKMTTKIGMSKSVAKVNNEGIVTKSYEVEHDPTIQDG